MVVMGDPIDSDIEVPAFMLVMGCNTLTGSVVLIMVLLTTIKGGVCNGVGLVSTGTAALIT